MLNFEFCTPTRYVFGQDAESRAGELCKRFGATRVLVHFGGKSALKSGLIDRVGASLEEAGLPFILLGGVQPNPRDALVREGIRICREEGVDFILAVGGGSTIDSSKAIAMGTLYTGGDFWDLYEKKAPITAALPLGVVLTIPAAGCEGSPNPVITREDGMLKRGVGSDLLRARFALMNPVLTYTLPPYQTASGCADILTHVFERYFTRTEDCDFSDRMCEAVMGTIVHNLPLALSNPEDYGARANIMWAGTWAHNGLVGIDRENDWASHQIEHELSALYDCAHGAGLAVVAPAWMRHVLDVDAARFAQFAHRVFHVEMDFANPRATALRGIDALESFYRACGLPTRAWEIKGFRREDIPLLARKCKRNNGEYVGFFKPLENDDILAIYEIACRAL